MEGCCLLDVTWYQEISRPGLFYSYYRFPLRNDPRRFKLVIKKETCIKNPDNLRVFFITTRPAHTTTHTLNYKERGTLWPIKVRSIILPSYTLHYSIAAPSSIKVHAIIFPLTLKYSIKVPTITLPLYMPHSNLHTPTQSDVVRTLQA
jgi:hypothetical protein